MSGRLLAFLLTIASAVPAFAAPRQSHLASVGGDVFILFRDDSNKAWVPARANMPVQEGDRIRTGGNGRAEIAFRDGSLIELQQRSNLHFVDLKPTRAVFGLSFGILLAKFQRIAERPIQVRTPTAVAAVRGTEMGVYTEGEDSVTRVAVFAEGEVEVESSGRGDTVILKDNKETEISPGAHPTQPSTLQFFKYAQKRIEFLRKRQKHFQNRFQKKYGLPSKP